MSRGLNGTIFSAVALTFDMVLAWQGIVLGIVFCAEKLVKTLLFQRVVSMDFDCPATSTKHEPQVIGVFLSCDGSTVAIV